MDTNITYQDYSLGPVEICQDLCDRLMAYQAQKATIYREVLEAMNFRNRLKPSFDHADEKYLLVAFDGDKPIGYVFATCDTISAESKLYRPDWASSLPTDSMGFYPDWLTTPAKIGCLNNLYVLPEYRGYSIGRALTDQAMDWLHNISDVEYLFVHVSNGNNIASFYEQCGFEHSHSTFGGFIETYISKNRR